MDTSIKSSQTKSVEYVLMKSIWKLYIFFLNYGYPYFIFEFESIGCHPEPRIVRYFTQKISEEDSLARLYSLSNNSFKGDCKT